MSNTDILIKSLNEKLTSDRMSHIKERDIVDIIRREIKSVFGIDDKIKAADYQSLVPEKLKKTYHELARALTIDRLNTNPYAVALKAKNMESLPHSILNSVWDEITKKSTVNTENIPTTSYYPLDFAQKKIESLVLLIKEFMSLPVSLKESDSVNNDFNKKFKYIFSEFYYYENYPLWAQYIIYGFYSSINVVIFSALVALFIATIPFTLLNQLITYPLLDIGTESRYLQFDAKILTMKEILDAYNFSYTDFQDDEIIEAFEHVELINKDSQAQRLAELGLDNLAQHQVPLYFNCYFVIEHINNLDSNADLVTFLDDDCDTLTRFRDSFVQVKEQELRQQIQSLMHLDSIGTLYTKIREFQNNQLESACKQYFAAITARQQIASIGKAIYAMTTDKTQAIFNRILRGIVLTISAPIILASCFIKLLFKISFQILIAIKLLSAELVNAPLKAYSYFNSTSTADAADADAAADAAADDDTHDDALNLENIELVSQQSVVTMTAMQPLHSIGNDFYDETNDKTQAIFNRIYRGLILTISTPFILASYPMKLLFAIESQALMAINFLSAELVNAPLKAYSYFNSTSTSAEKTNNPKALTSIAFSASSS